MVDAVGARAAGCLAQYVLDIVVDIGRRCCSGQTMVESA